MNSLSGPVVLFDGECNLCNASVRFVLDRDPRGTFKFASLDSPVARQLISASARSADNLPDSVLLVEEGRVSDRSTAALRISRRLKWPWKLVYVLILVPRPLRDLAYDWIARRRHAWFGRSEACLVPTPELQSRFLS